MKRFYFVGDLHINDTNPRSRIDDFSTSILNKLEDVFSKAGIYNVEAIFFLGDIFHKPSGLSTRYMNKVIETFQKSPCPCYSIVGNHDIPFNRVDEVDNTSLGILFKSGALIHIDDPYYIKDSFNNIKAIIKGFDYNIDISNIEKDSDEPSICLAHSYGEDVSFGVVDKPEYLRWSEDNKRPFDYYILGHDHSYHPDKKIFDNSILYRLGALSRITSASSDTERKIQILELIVDEDLKFSPVEIQYIKSEECFNSQSLNKTTVIKDVDFNESLESVLENLNFNIQSSIYDILDEMELDADIVQTIEGYLKSNFIVRKDSNEQS